MNTTSLNNQQALIKSIAGGDKKAFQQLYDIHAVRVYNTALSFVQNVTEAEEVTQDVFISVFKNADKFKGESEISTWIYRIAVNTSLNQLKKRKRFAFLKFGEYTTETPHFEHPGVVLEQKENASTLFQAIDKLPEQQKTAFILCFVEELPRQEAADVMHISLKALESLLQRAKGNLRNILEDWYPKRRKK